MQHFPADLSNSRCWRAVLLCAVSGARRLWRQQPHSIIHHQHEQQHQSCDGTTTRVTLHCHPAVLLPLYSLIQQDARSYILHISLSRKSEKFVGGIDAFSFRLHHAFKIFIFMKLRKSNSYNANIWLPVSLHRNTNTLHGLCSKYWFDSPCAVIDELLCQHIPMVIIAKWGAVSRNPQEVSIF